LIAPNAHRLALCGTFLTSPAITSGAVCDLRKASRQNGALEETDGIEASATVEEQQRCLNLCIALLDQKLHNRLTQSIVVGFLAVLSITESVTALTILYRTPQSYPRSSRSRSS
jgi:hypothetical protein